jgi:hypothetical protein
VVLFSLILLGSILVSLSMGYMNIPIPDIAGTALGLPFSARAAPVSRETLVQRLRTRAQEMILAYRDTATRVGRGNRSHAGKSAHCVYPAGSTAYG